MSARCCSCVLFSPATLSFCLWSLIFSTVDSLYSDLFNLSDCLPSSGLPSLPDTLLSFVFAACTQSLVLPHFTSVGKAVVHPGWSSYFPDSFLVTVVEKIQLFISIKISFVIRIYLSLLFSFLQYSLQLYSMLLFFHLVSMRTISLYLHPARPAIYLVSVRKGQMKSCLLWSNIWIWAFNSSNNVQNMVRVTSSKYIWDPLHVHIFLCQNKWNFIP